MRRRSSCPSRSRPDRCRRLRFPLRSLSRRARWSAAALLGIAGAAVGGLTSSDLLPLPMTFEDFHLSGTQIGDVQDWVIQPSDGCTICHGPLGQQSDPYATWSTSKMAYAGRNPLFFAQMTLANQDVDNAGYFCMRCHVPLSFVTGNAYDPSGGDLTEHDMDGVNCHFCHSMVDPVYKPDVSPVEDESILAALERVPAYYGNAMFVLDPSGTRRGPREGDFWYHEVIVSPFHTTGDMCGTCHDVGNVATARQPDGTYRYNALDVPPEDEDPHTQFPLERTYTEWTLSAFADGGVDMGGRFGGDGHPTGVMQSCQDCHMPRTTGQACYFGDKHSDLARHDFAGASAWTLEIVGLYWKDDPGIDQNALQIGRQNAVDMLRKAATLELSQTGAELHVRVINESGHKIPTGHIEGRRIWTNVKFFDEAEALVHECGHYDLDEAELDEASTVIYEMHVGLSEDAAKVTGLPPGVTTHMALADTIVKDTRIPPRGFTNATYEAGGAPVVGAAYADGQYWDDVCFAIPAGAASAEVTLNYQMMTRHYIEALRDGNVTDHWGETIYELWLQTEKAPPVAMVSEKLVLSPVVTGDLNGDGVVNVLDLLLVLGQWGPCSAAGDCPADLNGDEAVNVFDLLLLFINWS